MFELFYRKYRNPQRRFPISGYSVGDKASAQRFDKYAKAITIKQFFFNLSIFFGLLLFSALTAAAAIPTLYESEPNNTPADANPVSGETVIAGIQESTDQDGFMWTVSDVDARKRWTLELQGITDALTVLDIFTVIFAENDKDIKSKEKLFSIGTRGARPVTAEDLIFEPGEYLLGVAHAGGGSGRKGVLQVDIDTSGFVADKKEEEAGAPATAEDGKPVGSYRLAIREGTKLVVAERSPENETKNDAFELRPQREFAALSEAQTAWYRLEVPERLAKNRWRLAGQTAVGRRLEATLFDSEGEEVVDARINRQGKWAIPDLVLEPGNYWINLTSKAAGAISVVSTEITGQRVAGEEAEPNDDWHQANRIDLHQPTTGRFGRKGDDDYFSFDWPEDRSDQLYDVVLECGPDENIQICLLDSEGKKIQCRQEEGPVTLVDLLLTPGVHGFRIDRGSEGSEYTLRFERGKLYSVGREAEPNDRLQEAVALSEKNRVKGRLSGRESDVYRITVTEEPQLWRFQAIGQGVRKMTYYDGSGRKIDEQRFKSGSRRARMPNIFLLPGNHYIELEGEDGSYTLLARPIGSPDPNAEREPNDDDSRYHRIAMGQVRTGLLSEEADQDGYRFFLSHWDRIRLTASPPPDGLLEAELTWEKSWKLKQRGDTGKGLTLEGLFPPGNYELLLETREPSEAEYELKLERLARFGCPDDCEPNDHKDLASPLPRDHIIEGQTGDWYKYDFYRLPVFEEPVEMTISVEEPLRLTIVTDASDSDLAMLDRANNLYRAILPADTPTFIRISDRKPYRLEVQFNSDEIRPVPSQETPVSIDLAVDATTVAAYRRYGQRIAGALSINNSSEQQRTIALKAASSDYRWTVDMEIKPLVIAPGEHVDVPLHITVPADAWADRPVRISVCAEDRNGGDQEASVDIVATSEAQPVNPERAWSLPKDLLGGFNVAWEALGGRWVASDEERKRNEIKGVGSGYTNLFDSMAVKGQGLKFNRGQNQASVTVELAGDETLEVAGMTLNPLGSQSIEHTPREFEMSVSLDGKNFMPVLRGKALPIEAEQAFTLEQPAKARYARLTLLSGYTGEDNSVFGIGEWKVITRPGTRIPGKTGFNLLDPVLGGHVVWSKPKISNSWDSTVLKKTEKDPYPVRLSAGESLEWVVAFHHQRAAQIVQLEWLRDSDAPEEQRITRLEVRASIDSPFGPWKRIADWELSDKDEPQALDIAPVWARYIKFTVEGAERSARRAPPEQIRIIERRVDDNYRSVLSEWGFASPQSYYEYTREIHIPPPFRISGNNSRDTAVFVKMKKPVAGQVLLGKEADWYRVSVPDGDNILNISLQGNPTVRTTVELEDVMTEPLPLRRRLRRTDEHHYEAVVEPGRDYFLRIKEPPRNVVYSWDTSASVGAYLPVIYNALMAYAEDVVPGRDGVNFIPFGGSLLARDWYGEPYIIQTILNEHPRDTSSSTAEKTLAKASSSLASRAGTKAVVLITDAATPRYAPVWEMFREVSPRIFALGLSSEGAFSRNPRREQDLLQGWADVNGGHYDHVLSAGEMEVAFDRAATLLREPADYIVTVSSSFDEHAGQPGSIAVLFSEDDEAQAAYGSAVELILDASGSMLQRMQGQRRIHIARELLMEAVTEYLPEGTPLALRVFGHHEPNVCRTDLVLPLAPLDVKNVSSSLKSINAKNLAKTPIADSLAKVPDDLAQASGSKVVVLVTDGEETCDGDPGEEIEQLREQGIDVTINIVGFAIDDPDLAATFREWAALGGGRYLSASDPDELRSALEQALRTQFEVRDPEGEVVTIGMMNAEPVKVPVGYYDVIVRTSPLFELKDVEVLPGQDRKLYIK